jgi:hypothetical protein
MVMAHSIASLTWGVSCACRTNSDGRADEVKAFVPDIDSPRGLVWDQDRLSLHHPTSVFIDRDGTAWQTKRNLVTGIG